MFKSKVVWFFCLVFAAVFLLLSDAAFALPLLLVTVFLPILLIVINQVVARKVELSLSLPEVGAKGEKFICLIEVFNGKRWPLAPVSCRLRCENLLTGETIEPVVFFSVGAKKNQEIALNFSSQYCGCMRVSVASLCVYDVFGLVPVKLTSDATAETVVLPDTFPVNLTVMTHLVRDVEADEYSQVKSGFDPSETFAIREYEPGDNLQRIHWKLSSKFDEILIKEASLPVHHSFLVLLDTALPPKMERDASECDALLEIMLSICQQMTEEQISFEVGWQDRETQNFFHARINTMDELTGVANKLLRVTFAEDPQNVLEAFRETDGFNQFEHLLYISSALPANLEPFTAETLLTAIICSNEKGKSVSEAAQINLYFCSPEDYEQELFNVTI